MSRMSSKKISLQWVEAILTVFLVCLSCSLPILLVPVVGSDMVLSIPQFGARNAPDSSRACLLRPSFVSTGSCPRELVCSLESNSDREAIFCPVICVGTVSLIAELHHAPFLIPRTPDEAKDQSSVCRTPARIVGDVDLAVRARRG